MKRSYLLAALMTVAATGWILSGQVGGKSPAPEAEPATAPGERPVPQVRVRMLRAEERPNELRLFGRTEAERAVALRTEIQGRVAVLVAEKGKPVKKGDVILRLAMDDRKARLAEAEAVVAQYKIAYEAAEQLSEKKFRSRVKLAEAKAELETARAKLANIRLDIRRVTILAPFAGVVDDLPVEVGDYAAIGTVVANLIDLDPILVVGEVGERDVARIPVGAPARVRLTAGEEVAGTVRYVSKTGHQTTRTFRVEVAVDNPGGAIAEGLTTELRLPLGRVLAHRVSPAVLTLSDEGVVGVKAVDAGNRVRFHPVTMIADTPEGIWLAGLPAEVTLITVGQEFVRAGQRVDPVPETAAGGGGAGVRGQSGTRADKGGMS
jgi:multidrug efflux system membrane fusion protein